MCTHRVNSSVQYHISLLKRSHLTHSGWGESSLNAKRPAGAHKRRGLIFWGCCLKWNVRNTPSASTWVTWMEDYPATISSHHIRVLQDEMCGRSTHPAVFSWFPDPPTSQFPCLKSKQHTHTHTRAQKHFLRNSYNQYKRRRNLLPVKHNRGPEKSGEISKPKGIVHIHVVFVHSVQYTFWPSVG